MKSTKVASRYAKALLELAVEQKKVDSVLGDMHFLLQTNTDKKVSIFKLIFEQFEDVTISFVELITNNGREAILPYIAEEFDAQVKAYKGIVPMTLTSAHPLHEDTKKTILDKIQGSIKGTLEVTEEIDASLIGGFVVKMGDMQIDASVLNQFNNLKQRLAR
jgi:F-type H+-transporting ATPase subunit delta